MKTALMFLIVCSTPLAFATPAKYTIKQLLIDGNRVIIESDDTLAAGAALVATFSDGSQCSVTVTAVQGKYANADTSSCKKAGELKVGQELEASLAVPEPKPKTPEENKATQSASMPVSSATRNIADIQYLPLKGKVAAELGYTNSQNNTTTTTSSNLNVDTETQSGNTINGLVFYGITDDFAAGLKFGWLAGLNEKDSYGPGSSLNGQTNSMNSNGLTDPAVVLTYRAIDQQPGNLDVNLSYSPKTGDSKTATTKSNGNAYRGGDLATVSAEYGQKYSEFSYSFSVGYDLYGASTAKNPDTGVISSANSYNQLTVTATGQQQASDKFYLRGAISDTMNSSATITAPGSSDISVGSYSQVEIDASLIYEPKNNLALQVELSKELQANSTLQVGTTDIAAQSDETQISLLVGAQF